MSSSSSNVYFANRAPEELVQHCKQAEQNYRNACARKGLLKSWRLTYCQAFGFDPDRASFSGVDMEGDQDGATALRFRTNLSKPNIRQSIILALGERPAYQAVASNLDVKSEAQVPVAGKLMDYTMREAGLDETLYSSVESDRYFGSGSIHVQWDNARGNLVSDEEPATDPETGEPLFNEDGSQAMMPVQRPSGTVRLSRKYPWQVIRDANAEEDAWVIVKELISRYELAAMLPELADKILSASGPDPKDDIELLSYDAASCSEDLVVLRHFYHRNCAAVKGGRYVAYVGELPLWSRRCPIQDGLPVADVCTMRYFGSRLGHSEASDLVAQQEVLDDVFSTAVTNIVKFGEQSLFVDDGVDFDPARPGLFKLPEGKNPPRTIQFQQLPDATKFLLEWLPSNMQRISGLNETAMGNPSSANMSGVAIATLTQIAQKYQRNTQRAADEAIVRVGNIALELLKANASAGFVAEIAGKADQPLLKFFSQQDLSGFRRVQIIRTNPLLGTFAGRQALWAEIKDLPRDQKRQACELMLTGSTDPIFEDDFSQTAYIRWENEQLLEGLFVEPAVDDDVKLHMQMHRAQRDKIRIQPESPEKQKALMAFNQHMLAHGQAWLQLDPTMAEALGLPVPSITTAMRAAADQETDDSELTPPPKEPKPARPAEAHPNLPE